MTCPLCLNKTIDFYHQDKLRDYWQCNNCQLVFVKSKYYLSSKKEKAVYDLHQNNPLDIGYRIFLNKLLIPLKNKLSKNANGLDFGSGPGPTISVIMKEQGINVENYDIYYDNHPELLKRAYDFITCTEVVEHLYHPHEVFSRISAMLNSGGFLGVMTKRVTNKEKFKNWHYKNDPTHVCFYNNECFEYIAKQWDFKLELISGDTLILQKI
jgi:2-polyprenyl-3-methyl-5-hydroxy-6-metoxy-1,4-benzoquinol methylase